MQPRHRIGAARPPAGGCAVGTGEQRAADADAERARGDGIEAPDGNRQGARRRGGAALPADRSRGPVKQRQPVAQQVERRDAGRRAPAPTRARCGRPGRRAAPGRHPGPSRWDRPSVRGCARPPDGARARRNRAARRLPSRAAPRRASSRGRSRRGSRCSSPCRRAGTRGARRRPRGTCSPLRKRSASCAAKEKPPIRRISGCRSATPVAEPDQLA